MPDVGAGEVDDPAVTPAHGEGLLSVSGREHAIAGAPQHLLHQHAERGLAFGQEDGPLDRAGPCIPGHPLHPAARPSQPRATDPRDASAPPRAHAPDGAPPAPPHPHNRPKPGALVLISPDSIWTRGNKIEQARKPSRNPQDFTA